MQIRFIKLDHQRHRLQIRRNDGTQEEAVLETPVFFLHDLAHFVVETALRYEHGFWGMLAAGFSLRELGGKANPLTEALRFIEKIVGPVQSAYMGHFPPDFVATATAHLDFPLPEDFAENAVGRLGALERQWQALAFGETLKLQFSWPAPDA